MIEPTPGRVVWYYPSGAGRQGEQPLAAIISLVVSPELVNLMVIDPNGSSYGRQNVRLIQDGIPAAGEAEWMPYQKGQAAKTEELERQVASYQEPAPTPDQHGYQPGSQGEPAAFTAEPDEATAEIDAETEGPSPEEEAEVEEPHHRGGRGKRR